MNLFDNGHFCNIIVHIVRKPFHKQKTHTTHNQ